MSLRHPYRRPIAWLLAICLLFAQTAALAYACVLDQVPMPAEVSRAPCPAHLDDVDAGTFASGNLCEVHCQTPTVSHIQAGLDVPPAAVALHTVAPPIADAVDSRPPPPDPLRTPPRVLLRTSRLLI
jgi:hypothetical protein